jgi:MFS family permease
MAVQFAVGGALIPFVTLLFRERGLDLAQISQILAASSATLLVFPFVWGMLADRWIPLNRLFAIVNLLAGVALAFFVGQRHFMGLLIGYTLFFACFNPTLSLINALCFHHLSNPTEHFGRIRSWGSLGWIVPFVPISIWLVRADRSFDIAVYLSMGLCAAMACLSFWLPHTPPGAGRFQTAGVEKDTSTPTVERQCVEGTVDIREQMHSSYGSALLQLFGNLNYMVLLLAMFLVAGSFSLLTYYSPAVLQDAGVSRPWIGPIQAVAVVSEIGLFQIQPALMRRWNYAAVILAGSVALLIRQGIFGLVGNAWILGASNVLAGIVIVFFNTGVSMLGNTLAGMEVRATAQTLLLFFGQGAGPLVANALAIRLAGHAINPLRPVFLLGALWAGIAALIIAWRGGQLNGSGLLETQRSLKTLCSTRPHGVSVQPDKMRATKERNC